jgi:hypothetical protein
MITYMTYVTSRRPPPLTLLVGRDGPNPHGPSVE